MSIKIYNRDRVAISLLLYLLSIASCKQVKEDIPLAKPQVLKRNYMAILDSIVPRLLTEYDVPSAGVSIVENGATSFVNVYGEH
ncbi:MAG: hypothetical protein WBA16_03515 [Nonlabens sp.]